MREFDAIILVKRVRRRISSLGMEGFEICQ